METSKRRLSCPLTVQLIWDSISNLRAQRQISNRDRIYKMMSKHHQITLSDVDRQLKYAVRDNLISCVHRSGKGNQKGVENDSYWFFIEKVQRDGHDWYCFECHRSGEVYSCESCFRVYHPFCVKEDVSSLRNFICPICKMLKSEITFETSKTDLNVLLGYTCNRLKEKVSGEMALTRPPSHLKEFTVDTDGKLRHHSQPTKDSSKQVLLDEDKFRQERLIFQPMDLIMMEEKAAAGLYNRIEEYQVDAQTIVHNVVIYYGVHSSYADLARQMLRDCIYDLDEIQQCRNCYRMSNEKKDKLWFCQPCNPPHELVYAKQRGYPYWPAKVIKKLKDGHYDVRFFGAYYQRAKVEKSSVKPISVNVKSLQIKRTPSWNKAVEELKKHQAILAKHKLVPITTLEVKDESESEHEDYPKAKKPFLQFEKLNEVLEIGEDCVRPDFEEIEDDINVVSSSSQVSRNIKYRSVYSQTGDRKKSKASTGSFDFANLNAPNIALKELRERMQADFKVIKETALRDLSIELDKDHLEKSAFLTEVEREKRRELEERLKEEHAKEIKELKAAHAREVSEIKKKQWCWNCDKEAIYHCCWNTSYCSTKCQQTHWQNEHKLSCRHKRN